MEEKAVASVINRAGRDTLAVILAGGRGSRLHDLTGYRSKPAVPFAGKYRIIDFTLSNCINSGLRRIAVLTQYRSHSLMLHMERGWSLLRRELDEFIEILPAQERLVDSSWYQGTADAVYQNLDIIREHRPKYVLILAGDHIYKMDYTMMTATHVRQNADVVIGCVEMPSSEASQFGILQVDEGGKVTSFVEKPVVPVSLPNHPGRVLASMGIYLFEAELLYEILTADARKGTSRHDFGADILPELVHTYRLVTCPFRDLATGSSGYWRDVGTLDAYWAANLELAGVTPPLNLYDDQWPIRTASRQLPPAKFVFDNDGRRGQALDSLISSGCIVSGGIVRHCVISPNVRVECGAEVTSSVVLPDVRIGERCRIRNAVIDSGCDIAADTLIGYNDIEDARRYFVSSKGVVLVSPSMLEQATSLFE